MHRLQHVCYRRYDNVDITMHAEPSFMEEWRKGWHPENKPAKGASQSVLLIGSGPAGLEAARMLGGRGYEVALAEADSDLRRGCRERLLPNLSAWGRVMDYRLGQIEPLANVSVYQESGLRPKTC